MGKLKGVSLRYKLLAALTIIPMIGLSLFLLLAVNIFEKDKIAYVFDSSLSISKNRATRVTSEIGSDLSIAQAVVLSYRADTKNLAEAGQYYFEREAKFHAFQIHALNEETGVYEKTVDLAKDSVRPITTTMLESFTNDLISEARTKGIVVLREPGGPHVWLGARFGDAADPKHVVALSLFEASELAQVFSDRGPYMSFLLRNENAKTKPVFASIESIEGKWGPAEVWGEVSKNKIPEGIAELKSPQGRSYLVSFVDSGVADLVVVSMVDRQAALQAVDLLLKKSVLFFLAVISATAILAVLASRGLTSALGNLSSATQKIAEGDFGVRVDEKSGGEIGSLAKSFNIMAEEVSRLIGETAQKARMESELATAKAVQETLFPEPHARMGTVQVSGYYMPASECGGDWWHYCENGDKVYIWIADATGHGAPAALLTSATRAVVSVITRGPALPVSEALGILNRAICETSKGSMMMTFFLACIDKNTGEMTYSNASHEPPLILHKTEAEPSREDFSPLNDVNNPRLGEQIDCIFKESRVQLEPEDQIVFYTDGVIDVKNPEQKQFGERRFLKLLASEMHSASVSKEALGQVVDKIESFRSDTALDDDVTLILCTYKGAA
ncbi:MAG: SpoIIE family protein phosphatase [Bdellovibrionota bacterium]